MAPLLAGRRFGVKHIFNPAILTAGRTDGARGRYRVNDQDQAHFVTSTVVAWLPLFTIAARCDILIKLARVLPIQENSQGLLQSHSR
jgi:hypothetical protein